ncbi:MAG: hypothetical protein M3Y37_00665, partial [Chloroflexota bacterium]|nr:hypothetical protein [Chloroflexota bacterium]
MVGMSRHHLRTDNIPAPPGVPFSRANYRGWWAACAVLVASQLAAGYLIRWDGDHRAAGTLIFGIVAAEAVLAVLAGVIAAREAGILRMLAVVCGVSVAFLIYASAAPAEPNALVTDGEFWGVLALANLVFMTPAALF